MKTTIDIPEKDLKEAIRNTGAKTKREAVVTAVQKFNKRKRLEALNARIHGTFKDFMTQADLKIMRETATPTSRRSCRSRQNCRVRHI